MIELGFKTHEMRASLTTLESVFMDLLSWRSVVLAPFNVGFGIGEVIRLISAHQCGLPLVLLGGFVPLAGLHLVLNSCAFHQSLLFTETPSSNCELFFSVPVSLHRHGALRLDS